MFEQKKQTTEVFHNFVVFLKFCSLYKLTPLSANEKKEEGVVKSENCLLLHSHVLHKKISRLIQTQIKKGNSLYNYNLYTWKLSEICAQDISFFFIIENELKICTQFDVYTKLF